MPTAAQPQSLLTFLTIVSGPRLAFWICFPSKSPASDAYSRLYSQKSSNSNQHQLDAPMPGYHTNCQLALYLAHRRKDTWFFGHQLTQLFSFTVVVGLMLLLHCSLTWKFQDLRPPWEFLYAGFILSYARLKSTKSMARAP